jgi:hypothetical protein
MPAVGNYERAKGYDVEDGVSLSKYHFVKFSGNSDTVGNPKVTAVTDEQDVPAGVAIFDVTLAELSRGKGASVLEEGISPVVASGAVHPGDLAGLTDVGTVRTAASGDRVVGLIHHGAADTELCTVDIELPGYLLP